MPVSPQDFALWSRMTGNPYPQTPAERMALAPEVYSYTRNIGRQGGPVMSPVRRAIDIAGKAALAAGAIAGSGYLLSQGFQKLGLDNEPDVGSTVAEAMPDVYSQASRTSVDITPPTTSDNYNQDIVPHQTGGAQELRGTTPQKPTLGPIEQKTATQSDVISRQQHFSPGDEQEQLASSAQPNPSIRDQAEELIGRVSAGQIAKFRQSPSYAANVRSTGAEELIGDTTLYVETPTPSTVVAGPVRETPGTRTIVVKEESPIAEMAAPAAVDVGSALRSKGLSLAGDEGGIRVVGRHGNEFYLNHPYSSHSKAGIRQTALQEEQTARELLESAGVSPEQAKNYWSTKLNALQTGVEPAKEVATPVTVTSPVPQRKTAEQMEDERLARMAFGNMPMEQATALLAAARAAKGSKTIGSPMETPAPIVTTRQPQPVRVSSEVSAPTARISPNEFLSAMSQQVGPVATYEIPSERSKAVRGLAFYPGGEIGVQMGKRKGAPTEYAYATADPYRLALSDYAEEGFPAGMGNIGGVVADKALAHQMGLQQSVNRGGTIRQERQPIYTGLMSDADIVSAGMGKSGSSRNRAMEQAERHFETKQIMQDLEERAARKRAGIM